MSCAKALTDAAQPEAMYQDLRRFLFALDPERAHNLALYAGKFARTLAGGRLAERFRFEHPTLSQQVLGLEFANPVGVAAGMDKNARLVDLWWSLGFGYAEVGSVSARRSRGNPRPRAFRLPDDEAIINRMGLNNQGAGRIARRIRSLERPFPVGINLAKTHDPSITGEDAVEDFRQSFRLLAPLADYIALNISCPNTREGKTFEEPSALDTLLAAIFEERRAAGLSVPVLVKVAPPPVEKMTFDSALEDVIDIALRAGVSGFIATNTAPDRLNLVTPIDRLERIGPGGLSGPPIESRALRMVRYLYRRTEGRVPVIGVGGVRSADTAYARIRAGASLVQLYTGLVYEGPELVRRVNEGLVALLERDGHASISEAIGLDA
jgi:dihydroorotate dehydrogenase